MAIPHIVDDPTEADVALLLSRMEWGIVYHELGEPEPAAENMEIMGIRGESRSLLPVTGISWKINQDVGIVYIDGKAFAFDYDRCGGYANWLERQSQRIGGQGSAFRASQNHGRLGHADAERQARQPDR